VLRQAEKIVAEGVADRAAWLNELEREQAARAA
jgi:hypothetical protein